MCHVIGDHGVPFGPDLSNWGQVRQVAEVVQALVDPAAKLAHGYDKPIVVTQNGHRLEGISKGYSYHAGAIRVKTMGGVTLKIPFRRPRAKMDYPKNHSWMPSAAAMGLSNQEVRDVAGYLQSDNPGKTETAPTIVPKFSRGVGPGWIPLGGEDFVNVNCFPDTFKWEDGHAWCTGRPTERGDRTR